MNEAARIQDDDDQPIHIVTTKRQLRDTLAQLLPPGIVVNVNASPDSERKLMTTEIAKRTGRNPRTVVQWIRRHGLPGKQVAPGGPYEVLEADWNEWWSNKATAAGVHTNLRKAKET